jgi:taurine transport system ATP-binding protein
MSQLTLSQVCLHYGSAETRSSLPVLQDIDLEIRRGDFVSIIGRSGSGKTSLLNLAAGFVFPTAGRVLIDGRPITGPGVERAVVFQEDALFPWRSVEDNVALAPRLAGASPDEQRRKARRWLEAVGLGDHAKRRIWELSGGQRQRVGIARALAAEPEFLLMDEPLGALDAMTRDQMHELLLNLWHQSHAGALLITHSVEEALFLSTRVVVLAPGPGRILRQESFDFGQRFLAGADPRALKSEPCFIAARERLLAAIYGREMAA